MSIATVWNRVFELSKLRYGLLQAHRCRSVEAFLVRKAVFAGKIAGRCWQAENLCKFPPCGWTILLRSAGPAPHVIKIDVEGAESEVLKGAVGILQAHRPALFVEVHTASENTAVNKILDDADYSARWDIPAEGFPRQCFAVPCGSRGSRSPSSQKCCEFATPAPNKR